MRLRAVCTLGMRGVRLRTFSLCLSLASPSVCLLGWGSFPAFLGVVQPCDVGSGSSRRSGGGQGVGVTSQRIAFLGLNSFTGPCSAVDHNVTAVMPQTALAGARLADYSHEGYATV